MEIYKHFFQARRHTSKPIAARFDGKGCWRARLPPLLVIKSTSFRAVLSTGPSDTLIRSFTLGKADQYHCVMSQRIGDKDSISLYTSEQQACWDYDYAVSRCELDTRWQRL